MKILIKQKFCVCLKAKLKVSTEHEIPFVIFKVRCYNSTAATRTIARIRYFRATAISTKATQLYQLGARTPVNIFFRRKFNQRKKVHQLLWRNDDEKAQPLIWLCNWNRKINSREQKSTIRYFADSIISLGCLFWHGKYLFFSVFILRA